MTKMAGSLVAVHTHTHTHTHTHMYFYQPFTPRTRISK